MERSNYPVTYRVMSAISADNQRTYFRLLKLQVALLLSIATVSAIDWQLFPFLRTVSIVAASFLIVLSFLQMFAQIQKYDKKWFESRAVAESVKVQTWRFMMQVAPYHDSSDSISPKERFVADVRQLLEEQPDAKVVAGSKPIEGPEVSQFMLDQRTKPVGDRRDFYLKGRIQDQKDWYSKKAATNCPLGRTHFRISFQPSRCCGDFGD